MDLSMFPGCTAFNSHGVTAEDLTIRPLNVYFAQLLVKPHSYYSSRENTYKVWLWKVRKCKGDNLWLDKGLHCIPQVKAVAVCVIAGSSVASPFLIMTCGVLTSTDRTVLWKVFLPMPLSKTPGGILTQLLCIS